MPDATDRPQDVGRSHRAKGRPSAETASLLAEYQEAMRGELRAVLGELAPVAPVAPPPGLGLVPEEPEEPKRPDIATRIRLWDLAIKIGRELGTEIDPGPLTAAGPAKRSTARRKAVDYG